MKQNLAIQQTLQQKYLLTQKNQNALEVLKMNHEEITKLVLQFAQRNPMFACRFHQEKGYEMMDTVHAPISLKEELYYQLHTCKTSIREDIAAYLIESLDENGYININEEEVAHAFQVTLQEVQDVFTILRTFEPSGVFAKDAADSLYLQCLHMGNTKGAYLLKHHADAILSHDLSSIAKQMNLTIEEIKDILHSIRKCHPYPCAPYQTQTTINITPEVDIIVEDEEIRIEPISVFTPSLHQEYVSVMEEHPQLKQYFQEASIFVDMLHRRNASLLMIINELVTLQKGYFLYHDELRPCTLKDIAQKLGMHESTVSRALHQKYYRFEGECYAFKQLFSAMTCQGDSADGIRKAILSIIRQEDKHKPFSDQQLEIKLSAMDLKVSRRTVAKYREQLHIPGSSQRKLR